MKKVLAPLLFLLAPLLLNASAEIDLFSALLDRDWTKAEKILDRYPRLLDKRGEEEFAAALGDRRVSTIGRTPLIFSLELGLDLMAVKLLDYGAGLEVTDSQGWTPLMTASYQGNLKLTTQLLDRGAELEVFTGEGLSPLSLAVGACRFDTADLLLARGADLYGPIPGAEPLVQSIYESKIRMRDALQILDVGVPGYPLFSAIGEDNYGLARMILLQGMKPDSPDSQGVTPLMIAASREEPYYTELLLEQGADPDRVSACLLSPLSIALFLGREENGELLIQAGADINGGSSFTDTPLYYALIGGFEAPVRLLVDRGCTVTRRDREGRTGLMYAAFLGDWLSVQALLKGGARPTAVDNRDRGVIWYAMTGYLMTGGENYYTIIDRLIGEGADSTEYADMAGSNRKFRTLLEARWRE